MKNNKGITLIALVVTIIILLILAGISIAMLTGDNGILTNAGKTSTENAYYGAEERFKLAYMAVKTEIMAQVVKDGQYDARKQYTDTSVNPNVSYENVKALAKIVYDDLVKGNTDTTKKFTVTYKGRAKGATSGDAIICVKYEDSNIDQGVISTGKPANEGKVFYTITLDDQDATPHYDLTETQFNEANTDAVSTGLAN